MTPSTAVTVGLTVNGVPVTRTVEARTHLVDFLREHQVLVVQGTGFNWPTPDHLRIVTLPEPPVLVEAIGRLAEFCADYRAA